MPEQSSPTEFTLVEQAMGHPPGWLTYWGITVVVLFLGVVLGITSLVKFPDTLKAEALTYIDRPPVVLFPHRPGVVQALFVQEGDSVAYDSPLLILESTANWSAVLQLDSLLQIGRLLTRSQPFLSKDLGALNKPYQALLLLDHQLKDAYQNNITQQLVSGTRNEMEQNKRLNASLQEQKKVFQKEIDNITVDLRRARKLRQDGALSQQKLEEKENLFFQSKRTLHQLESAIIANNIKIQQLSLKIPVSEKQQHDLLFNLETAFKQQQELLQTAVEQWKNNNLLYAKSAGRIVLNKGLQVGSQLKVEEAYLTITPFIADKKSYLKATLEAAGSGKISIGQKALVYFNNYPSAEYGALSATVLKVAPIPTEEKYEVLLALPTDWVTNYDLTIPKQHNLSATVAIQTKEYTLLERIFSGLIDAVNN